MKWTRKTVNTDPRLFSIKFRETVYTFIGMRALFQVIRAYVQVSEREKDGWVERVYGCSRVLAFQ